MTVTITDRAVPQAKLAEILTTALAGILPTGDSVLTHAPDAGATHSPIVSVVPAGSKHAKMGLGPAANVKHKSIHRFEIMRFVPVADLAHGWTEAEKEALLSLLDKTIAQVVANNEVVAGYWVQMRPFDELSEVLPVQLPADYDMEHSYVEIEVHDG